MTKPPVWNTPHSGKIFKDGSRAFSPGSFLDIPFSFHIPDDQILNVVVAKGTLPRGITVSKSGLSGEIKLTSASQLRDYTFTLRATVRTSSQGQGSAEYFTEDRTFSLVCGMWLAPEAGDINSSLNPYTKGSTLDISLVVDDFYSDASIEMISGSLPPGLVFSPANKRIRGTVGPIPKGTNQYVVGFRAKSGNFYQDRSFRFIVDPTVEPHRWDSSWLDGMTKTINPKTGEIIYQIATAYRGAGLNIPLKVINPDNDILNFDVLGYAYPDIESQDSSSYEGLPDGLEVDIFGRIVGTPTISTNSPGDYYFKIYVRNPKREDDDTPNTIFKIKVGEEILISPELSDQVKWITEKENIGSTFETHASHFEIKAVPLYESATLDSNEYQEIRYSLAQSSKPLPPGLFLNEKNGRIQGICPYVTGDHKAYFTAQARVVFVNRRTGAIRESNILSERTFYFTIKNLFDTNSALYLYIKVPPLDRREIVQWTFGNKAEFKGDSPFKKNILTVLGRENLFRYEESSWGRVDDLNILLVGGLKNISDEEMQGKLRDYHRRMDLFIGEIKTAKGYDPDGNYIYDVLYLKIEDPMKGAGGFDALGRDVIKTPVYDTLVRPNPSVNDRTLGENEWTRPDGEYDKGGIPEWNLSRLSDRYHPTGVYNARADLINTANRQPWPQGGEDANRGVGLAGQESLPLWMSCEQTPGKPGTRIGYIPAIELAFLKPGKGAQALITLKQAGIEDNLKNKRIVVDRYLLKREGYSQINFDREYANPPTDDFTTFDGPDLDDPNNPPTDFFTTFDLTHTSQSKYLKFPPGDI